MLKRLPILIAVLTCAVWLGNIIVKNFIAASLIAYGEDEASRNAAVALSPSNPAVIAARGKYLLYRAEPPQPDEAINELQRATALSPRDYRFWLELGRAYESTGETARAETAMQRAADLAPLYFEPRWAIANLRLRAGKTDQAMSDFRRAITLARSASNEPSSRYDERAVTGIFNTIYTATGEDAEALRRIVPRENISQSYLASFLAARGRIDEAMQVFRNLPESADPVYRPVYRNVILNLLRESQAKGRFVEAIEVWSKLLSIDQIAAQNSSNMIFNSGFERKPLSEIYPGLLESQTGFDWIVRRHSEVRVRRTDLERHSGDYALHLNFAAPMRSEFQEISQTIAVNPSQSYRLSWFVKTKNVSPLENEIPYIEISDPIQPGRFSARVALPVGTNDWMGQTVSLSTPEGVRGLRLTIRSPQLRTVDRLRIAETWLDDFSLEMQ